MSEMRFATSLSPYWKTKLHVFQCIVRAMFKIWRIELPKFLNNECVILLTEAPRTPFYQSLYTNNCKRTRTVKLSIDKLISHETSHTCRPDEHPRLAGGHIPSRFPPKLCTNFSPHPPSCHMPGHFILPYLIILVIFDEEYKLRT
jgi:hypothetical protein